MHRDHIGVAFHQQTFFLFDDIALGKIKPVQGLALVVDLRIDRVQVFRDLVVLFKGTGPKPDHPAGKVVDGKDDPSAEAVVFLVFLDNRQSGLFKVFNFIAGIQGVIREGIPFVLAVTQLEPVDGLLCELPLLKIFQSDGPALFGIFQLGCKIFACKVRHLVQGFPFVVCLTVLLGLALLTDLDVVFLCQVPERFGIGKVLMLHEEVHGIAALT